MGNIWSAAEASRTCTGAACRLAGRLYEEAQVLEGRGELGSQGVKMEGVLDLRTRAEQGAGESTTYRPGALPVVQ